MNIPAQSNGLIQPQNLHNGVNHEGGWNWFFMKPAYTCTYVLAITMEIRTSFYIVDHKSKHCGGATSIHIKKWYQAALQALLGSAHKTRQADRTVYYFDGNIMLGQRTRNINWSSETQLESPKAFLSHSQYWQRYTSDKDTNQDPSPHIPNQQK